MTHEAVDKVRKALSLVCHYEACASEIEPGEPCNCRLQPALDAFEELVREVEVPAKAHCLSCGRVDGRHDPGCFG